MTAVSLERRTPIARAVLAQTAMELRLLVRSSESLLVTLGLPLGIVVFFSSVEVLPTGDGRGVDFLVPGALAVSAAATGLVAVAIQTAFERKYLVLKRLGASPLPRWGFLIAKGLAVAAVLTVQTLLVVGVAAAGLGWRPSGGFALAALAVVLGAVTSTALGLLMAGTLRAEATLGLSNAVFIVLVVISGATFDAGVLPEGVAVVGRALPVGALSEALRAALSGAGLAAGPWIALGLWAVVSVAAAARAFRFEP